MKKPLITILALSLTVLLYNCKDETEPAVTNPPGTTFIEPSTQRTGDPVAGYEYLIYGDYVASGIPYQAFQLGYGSGDNLLGRTGDNADVPFNFTAVDATNGVRVVAANCFSCHAQRLTGDLIVGRGGADMDFTNDQSAIVPIVDQFINLLYGPGSDEYEAYEPFRRAALAIGPHLITETRGVNPADKLAAVLAAHRKKEDLTWIEEPQLPIPEEVIPTDIPPWWLMKKKNAMFYNALGNGDFAKFMMASSILTLRDSSEARVIDEKFEDVLAYIMSIEPPAYPESIDETKVTRGEAIFNDRCSGCHGTYGENESYPNLLVDIETVKTDPALIESTVGFGNYVDWYNQSWFAQEPNAAHININNGYVAQPLDGVWASAPYLHNGSIPDLYSLLKSSERPTYWKRSFDSTDINWEKVGWNYTEESSHTSSSVYDTTKRGYSNQGHYFGDGLTEDERWAVIEYLKTL